MNRPQSKSAGKTYWMYGTHAVLAALNNPERRIKRLAVTQGMWEAMGHPSLSVKPEILLPKDIEQLVGRDSVHQGIAIQSEPLEGYALDEVLESERPLLLLDQVTDPHNVGAILRSAAAFNVAGVVAPRDNTAQETGALAKAACGALDIVPLVYVTNLSRAIEEIQQGGYWVVGMDGEAKTTLRDAKLTQKTALVLGAEGKGLRRLTAENCDQLIKLPMSEQMESLNVSNAAAIALYELFIGGK